MKEIEKSFQNQSENLPIHKLNRKITKTEKATGYTTSSMIDNKATGLDKISSELFINDNNIALPIELLQCIQEQLFL